MNKKFFLLALAMVVFNISYSQTDTIYVNGVRKIRNSINGKIEGDNPSPLKKDDYLFELSYGYPFIPIREAEFFGIDLFSTTSRRRVNRNTNHICARTEYMLNEEFSVGLEFTYASIGLDYIRTTQNGSGLVHDSLFTAKANKIRFLVKMGYHFNISERFDAYGTAGFGYKQFTISSKDETLSSADFVNEILPVAIRLSVGGRFFFNENVALHVEGGIGGPMMQIGLTYKMH